MPRILIVDDSEDLVDGYQSLLTRKGFEVDTAFDVDNNVRALKRMIESAAAELATVTWFAPEGPRMETDAIGAMAVRLLATIGVGST